MIKKLTIKNKNHKYNTINVLKHKPKIIINVVLQKLCSITNTCKYIQIQINNKSIHTSKNITINIPNSKLKNI